MAAGDGNDYSAWDFGQLNQRYSELLVPNLAEELKGERDAIGYELLRRRQQQLRQL